jgi:hypothetical protein
MMEILLHTHPCYPIDASVSRGYAGIFFCAHLFRASAPPVQEHRNPYLERKSFPATQLHLQQCAVERLAGPFNLPERRMRQFW